MPSDRQTILPLQWHRQSYESGTMVVMSDSADLPHYRIGYPNQAMVYNHSTELWSAQEVDETARELVRYDIAKVLENWLNGGDFPERLKVLQLDLRMDAQPRVFLPDGMEISSGGPFIEMGQDDDSYAQSARKELLDAIKEQRRPSLQRVRNPEVGREEEI